MHLPLPSVPHTEPLFAASFKAIENEDGDCVFQTKTRELGVYIIAEKPYTTAAAEDVETPDDGKAIPDTGIWA